MLDMAAFHGKGLICFSLCFHPRFIAFSPAHMEGAHCKNQHWHLKDLAIFFVQSKGFHLRRVDPLQGSKSVNELIKSHKKQGSSYMRGND